MIRFSQRSLRTTRIALFVLAAVAFSSFIYHGNAEKISAQFHGGK